MFDQTRPFTIWNLIAHFAENTPDALAIVAPGRNSLTYGSLQRLMRDVCYTFRSMGISQTDRVALILPSTPVAATAFISVAACSIAAPLNPGYTQSEWEFYLKDLRATHLITTEGFAALPRKVAQELGISVQELVFKAEDDAGWFQLRDESGKTGFSNSCDKWNLTPEATCSDVALLLHTSGSTSRPKSVPLTQESITLSSYLSGQSLGLSARDRSLHMLPMYHVHGLISALLIPLSTGGSIAVTSGFESELFSGWLEELRPTWYSAPPAMHQMILDHAIKADISFAQSTLRFIRSGSAPLWPELIRGLQDRFCTPVVEAYGMTEVPQISGNPPKKCKPGSVGKRVVSEMAIMDENGIEVSAGKLGEIAVRGPTVTRGYESCSEGDVALFRNGWFYTGDLGWLDAEGYLFLAGRLKEVINRGGEKVSPSEIDIILLNHPAVNQATTFARPHPVLGEDVVAVVVVAGETVPDETGLRKYAACFLPHFKVPARIFVVNEIPKGPGGKVQRSQLPRIFAEKLEVSYDSPVNEWEELIAEIYAEVLNRQSVGRSDNFFDLGGHSLLAAQVINRLNSYCNVNLNANSMFEAPTVAALAALVGSSCGNILVE